jgi:hypothetical protein
MTWKMRWFLSSLGVAAWLTTAASSNAQMAGGGAGGGGAGGGGAGGGGASSASLGVVGSGSSGGGIGGSGGSSSPFSGVTGSGGAGGAGGANGSNLTTPSNTNFLSTTFSNPLYEGRPNQTITATSSAQGGSSAASNSTNSSQDQPGGFGVPSFGTVTTTTTSSKSNSSLTATASTTSTTTLAYSTVVKFKTIPIVSTKLQADLRATIDGSNFIQKPSGIRIDVADRTVVLSGRVKNDDERRQAEALIRLTPGVRMVKNDLQVLEASE